MDELNRYAKVNDLVSANTIDYIDAAIATGDYYVALLERTNIPANSTYYYHAIAPADADILIDNIDLSFDMTNAGTGSLQYRTDVFLSVSDGNDFTYTPGSAYGTVGRALNGYYINSRASFAISAGGTATVTGTPDFTTLKASYYLQQTGNNQSLTRSGTGFFEESRKLIIPAGTSVLFRTTTTGTIAGTFNLSTYVNFFERHIP